MEVYKKPLIVNYNTERGIIPAAIAAAPITLTLGVSLAQAAGLAAAAALSGAAVGVAATKLSGKITITDPILALTARKNFALE